MGGVAEYQAAADTLGRPNPAWDEAFNALSELGAAIKDANNSGYGHFNTTYARKNNGRNWHDPDLEGVLAFMAQRGGLAVLGRLAEQHDPGTTTDYADDIVAHLRAGRLVVVDQSTGDPEMNRAAAERLMWRVFNRQKGDFVRPTMREGRIVPPPDVLVYVEEAHNLLPAKADDLTTVWARTAKEGSKFRVGNVRNLNQFKSWGCSVATVRWRLPAGRGCGRGRAGRVRGARRCCGTRSGRSRGVACAG